MPYSTLLVAFIVFNFNPCAPPEGDVHVLHVPCVVLSNFNKEKDVFARLL